VSNIQFFFEDIDSVEINQSNLKIKIKELIINELKKTGEISVIFCSDEYLLKLNEQYLNHHYFTDIITFDYVKKSVISGDLFISIDRVKENAEIFKTQLIKEIYRVVFHGILHLVGYGDKTENEQKLMREKEDYYLNMTGY
jgi:rRNA maturation RNase YbeY